MAIALTGLILFGCKPKTVSSTKGRFSTKLTEGEDFPLVGRLMVRGQTTCSATIIGQCSILTADHCRQAREFQVFHGQEMAPFNIAAWRPIHRADLAVATVSQPFPEHLIESLASIPDRLRMERGTVVQTVGYGTGSSTEEDPIGHKQLVEQSIDRIAEESMTDQGRQLYSWNLKMQSVPLDQAITCGGDSGGPTYHEGQIIGVTSFSHIRDLPKVLCVREHKVTDPALTNARFCHRPMGTLTDNFGGCWDQSTDLVWMKRPAVASQYSLTQKATKTQYEADQDGCLFLNMDGRAMRRAVGQMRHQRRSVQSRRGVSPIAEADRLARLMAPYRGWRLPTEAEIKTLHRQGGMTEQVTGRSRGSYWLGYQGEDANRRPAWDFALRKRVWWPKNASTCDRRDGSRVVYVPQYKKSIEKAIHKKTCGYADVKISLALDHAYDDAPSSQTYLVRNSEDEQVCRLKFAGQILKPCTMNLKVGEATRLELIPEKGDVDHEQSWTSCLVGLGHGDASWDQQLGLVRTVTPKVKNSCVFHLKSTARRQNKVVQVHTKLQWPDGNTYRAGGKLGVSVELKAGAKTCRAGIGQDCGFLIGNDQAVALSMGTSEGIDWLGWFHSDTSSVPNFMGTPFKTEENISFQAPVDQWFYGLFRIKPHWHKLELARAAEDDEALQATDFEVYRQGDDQSWQKETVDFSCAYQGCIALVKAGRIRVSLTQGDGPKSLSCGGSYSRRSRTRSAQRLRECELDLDRSTTIKVSFKPATESG